MRSLAPLPFLLLSSLPLAAQVPCGSKAVLTVHPQVAAPGQPIQITLTNTSSETLFQSTGCLYGDVSTGTTCSGALVYQRACTLNIETLAPGESRTELWFQNDNSGQQVPPGSYSSEIEYYTAGNPPEGCCFSVAIAPVPAVDTYCTAGTSASGCKAQLVSAGVPSASAASGFFLETLYVEGGVDGLFFFGPNGRQANPWGNGTSFQCVVPPVKRAGLLQGTGSAGLCDGSFSQDLHAFWTALPHKNPGGGATVQAQFWYRDPQSTSNQTTSLSDAIEFVVGP